MSEKFPGERTPVVIKDQMLSRGNPGAGVKYSAFKALSQAADRPIDMVMIGDSTQLFGGYGWHTALTKAFQNRFGIWATSLYPLTATGAGTQYSSQSGAGTSGGTAAISSGTSSGTGTLTGADAFFNDRQLPDAGYNYQATDLITSAGAPGIILHDNFRSDNLRYHVYYGTFPGGGSFRPGARLETAPNTPIVDAPVTYSANGPLGEAEATMDIPADPNRTLIWAAKVRRPGGTGANIVTGPVLFLANRVQNLDRKAGVSLHSFYAIGGQSAYDMAQFISGQGIPITFTGSLVAATSATLSSNWSGGSFTYRVTFSDGSVRSVAFTSGSNAITWTGAVTAGPNASMTIATNIPSLARLMWGFGKLRDLQISRGYKPLVVVRITSGLNDRNESLAPSIGPSPASPGSSALAYQDNMNAMILRIRSGWLSMGWSLSELSFLIVPSYPILAVDDMTSYRQMASILAQSNTDVSWVDYSVLAPGSETLAANGLVDGTHFTDTWADELARREVALI